MNSFNPEDYENDIFVVEMRSLGRGRGFEKIGEYSALEDTALTSRIGKRIRLLLDVIQGENQETTEDVEVLDDQLEELEDDFRALQAELSQANNRIRDLENEVMKDDELLSSVNDVLDGVADDDFTDLHSAVMALIEAYDDLLEETEDED